MPTHYKGKTGTVYKKALKEHKAAVKKNKKKTEPKLRPQPDWEMSDFQWVSNPATGKLKLKYTESGLKKKRKKKAPKAADIYKTMKPRT